MAEVDGVFLLSPSRGRVLSALERLAPQHATAYLTSISFSHKPGEYFFIFSLTVQ
jgi:hypothetical protein